jgi:hypothetical protein
VTTANAGQQVNASMRAHRIAIYPETALAAPSQPHQLPAEK